MIRNMTMMLALVVAALAFASAASAESSVVGGYGGQAATPQVEVKSSTATVSSGAPVAQAARGETLPFTGAELGVGVAFALALIGAGVLLRRSSKSTQ